MRAHHQADQIANLSGFNLSPLIKADWRTAHCDGGAAIERVASVGGQIDQIDIDHIAHPR